ncbi:EAL domain-containing protein [Roseibium aquae]|nr:EAL domain-containing protein [Roseibium aquae]
MAIRQLWKAVLLLGLVMTLAITVTGYSDRVANERAATEKDARFVARQASAVLQTVKLALDQLALTIAEDGAVQTQASLANIEAALPALSDIIVVNAEGVVVAERRDDLLGLGLDVSDRSYFSVHRAVDPGSRVPLYVGSPLQSRVDGSLSIPVSRPVLDRQGQLSAVIAVALRREFLSPVLDAMETAGGSWVFLKSQSAALPLSGGQTQSDPVRPDQATAVAGLNQPADAFAVAEPIDGWPLSIVVQRPLDDIHARALGGSYLQGLLGILATLAAAAGARLYGQAYRAMEERKAEAEAMAERLELASKAGQIGIWEYECDSETLFWDETLMGLYGVPAGQFSGEITDWSGRVHPDDLELAQDLFRNTIENGILYDTEFRIVTPAGETKHLKAYGMAVRNAAGRIVRVTGVNYDLSLLRRAELRARDSERRFKDIAESVPGAVFQYEILPNGADRVLYLSPGCFDIWGLTSAQISGNPGALWAMILPEDLPGMQASVASSASSLSAWDHRWRIVTAEGQHKHLHGRATPYRLADGTVRFNSIIFDVTEHEEQRGLTERARQDADMARQRLEHAFESLEDAFVVFDADERLVTANTAYRSLFKNPETLFTDHMTLEGLVRTLVREGVRPDADGKEEEWIAERLRKCRSPEGPFEMSFLDDRFFEVHDSRSANGDIVILGIDITEKRRQTRRLEELTRDLEQAKERAVHDSLHDALTGLPNRRHLDQYLYQLAAVSDPGREIIAIHVDIDRFKLVNDTLGHATGDKVIMQVASRLYDILPPTAFLARFGGDEFVIVCHGSAEHEAICHTVKDAFAKPFEINRQTIRITGSLGVAVLPADQAPGILKNSDIALHKAKDNGRNRVEVFTRDLQWEMAERKQLADEILHGMERNEFFAHFQPQFDAKTRAFSGLEALIRWRHPQRGILPPAAFMEVAEDLKVMGDLDRVVLQQAIAACSRLKSEGITTPKMSVNIGFSRISDPSLAAELEAMDTCGSWLAFELLETILLDEDCDEIGFNIDRIRERGIQIELDDFGSGRASMISLLKLQPDRIKIDRQLVMPLLDEPGQIDLVRAILEMATARGIQVTAEGVETMEHARILTELGCTTLQGYAFARPMPVEDLARFLHDERWLSAA